MFWCQYYLFNQFPAKYLSLYKKYVDTTFWYNQFFNFTQNNKMLYQLFSSYFTNNTWPQIANFDPYYTPNFTLILIKFINFKTPFTIFILPSFEPILLLIIQLNNFGIIKHYLCNHLPSTTNYHSMIIFTDFFWRLTLPG